MENFTTKPTQPNPCTFTCYSQRNQRLLRSGLQSATSDADDATASDDADLPPTDRGRRGADAWSSSDEGPPRGSDPRSSPSASRALGGDSVGDGCRTEALRHGGGTAPSGGCSSNQTAGVKSDEWTEPRDLDLTPRRRLWLNTRVDDATIDVL